MVLQQSNLISKPPVRAPVVYSSYQVHLYLYSSLTVLGIGLRSDVRTQCVIVEKKGKKGEKKRKKKKDPPG